MCAALGDSFIECENMKAAFRVTNPQLFNETVAEVEFLNLKPESENVFSGGINICTKANGVQPFFGLVYANDFETNYGFVIESVEEVYLVDRF